jgi:hypothetical protein
VDGSHVERDQLPRRRRPRESEDQPLKSGLHAVRCGVTCWSSSLSV